MTARFAILLFLVLFSGGNSALPQYLGTSPVEAEESSEIFRFHATRVTMHEAKRFVRQVFLGIASPYPSRIVIVLDTDRAAAPSPRLLVSHNGLGFPLLT